MTDGMGTLPGMGAADGAGSLVDTALRLGEWAGWAMWLPLALWTIWAAVGYGTLRRRETASERPLHPASVYRVGQVLLFTLPVMLLARGLAPDAVRDLSWPAWVSVSTAAPAGITSSPASDPGAAGAQDAAVAGAVQSGLSESIRLDPYSSEGVPSRAAAARVALPSKQSSAERPGSGALAARVDSGDPSAAASFGTGANWSRAFSFLSALALLLVAGGAAVGLALFGFRIRELGRLRAVLPGVEDPVLWARLEAGARSLGVTRPVDWRVGPSESVPMTFGSRRPLVSLPSSLLSDPSSVDLALRHELVHVRRHDFAWALAEGAVPGLVRIPSPRPTSRPAGQRGARALLRPGSGGGHRGAPPVRRAAHPNGRSAQGSVAGGGRSISFIV